MGSRRAVLNALRKEQHLAKQRVGAARRKTLPAPVGGWNTRDSDTRVGPQYAQKFTNLISSRDGIRPRKNPTVFATLENCSLEPHSMMVHRGTDGTDTMFAVGIDGGAGQIFNITAGGTISSVNYGPLNAQYVNSQNVNGRLVCATGDNRPFSYDGTTWSLQAMNVQAGEPALSTDKLTNLFPFKNRVYWWKTGDLGFWYSTLDTIGADLKYFDLSYVTREGGDLLTMTRYTNDGGAGPDDYPVFVTSRGEALIYQGTNPNDAAAWSFVGSFRVGKPPQTAAGATQHQVLAAIWGAQSWLITEQDYVALPQAMLSEGIMKPSMLSGALQNEMNAHSDKVGWQAILYPNGPWMLFNIPQGNETYIQHVIDLHTGAASRLTGMNATSWAVYGGELYYSAPNPAGTSNKPLIYKALATATPVSIEMLPGATDLRKGAKAFTGYRVWASTSASDVMQASATTELRTDYTNSANNAAGPLRWNEWILAGGVGTFVQLELLGTVNANVEIKHIDYLFEDGDPLTGYRDA